MDKDDLNKLSGEIIGAAIEVHKILGPGLYEYPYQAALFHELQLRGIDVYREYPIFYQYKGINLPCTYKADLLVENEIIVELKSQEQNMPEFTKQLLTYLRLTNKRLGLVINFQNEKLTEGIRRVVNNL